MEKRVLGLPYIDKGSFQAWFQVLDLAFENSSYEAIFSDAFNFEPLNDSIFQNSHSGFKWF